MKRAVLLIILIPVWFIGFLSTGGALPWTPAPGSGAESALSFLFQGQYSLIYALAFLLLLGFLLYRRELARRARALYLRVSVPPRYEHVYTEPELTSRMIQTERKMADTEQALNKFSTAIEKYATHLSSHTGAIRGLHAASQELQEGAARQNRVLMHFMENMNNPPAEPRKTPHWKIDPAPLKPPAPETPAAETPARKPEPYTHPAVPAESKGNYPPGCARNRQKKPGDPLINRAERYPDISPRMPEDISIDSESLDNVRKYIADLRARVGKARSRKTLADEALAAEAEIMKAIRNLNARLDASEFQE